jgi:hypothetical protein
MHTARRLAFLALFATACYSPSLPNGKQQCGPNDTCPNGYQCGPDNHCYKSGQVPKGGPDMAVPSSPDMAMACTAMSCKGGPKPFCDTGTGACVECLTDDNCPSGKVCSNKACVPGCTATHGCPDGGGMCDTSNKMCMVCMKDADCGGGTPRCDTASGNCVECLPTNDNCPQGKFCGQVNSVYTCQTGCQTVADCPKPDAGGMPACCNHICVDTDIDGKNCGMCNNDCGKESCCGGKCSDVTMDLSNCGLCGNACAGNNATWSCAMSMCKVGNCNQGFGDCNGSPGDGCEATLATDPNNCGMCNMKCGFANAVANCANSMCGIAMCNPGFGNCDGNLMTGCETNVSGDPNNCGMCGTKCTYANAQGACVAAKCALAMCNNGFSDCDNNPANGCESATASDINNCGGCNMKCGNVANATVACSNSKCTITACTNGFKDCDMNEGTGCEINVTNDVNNCGGCGTKCTPGANVTGVSCSNQVCAITGCAGGFANCNGTFGDGCEINTTNDPLNCGGCGHNCGGLPCVNSACQNMVEVKIGLFTPLGSNSMHSPNFLLGSPIQVTKPSTLERFGIISRSAGPHVTMALYNDLNGAPHTLLSSTPSTALTNSTQEIAVGAVALPVGQYWIMAVYDVAASVGYDTNGGTVDYIAFNYGGALPGTFPAPSTYMGQEFNYYIVVLQ